MPQSKIPYKKKSNLPMMGAAALKLQSPIGKDSQYAKMFGMGENILRTYLVQTLLQFGKVIKHKLLQLLIL